MRISSSIKMALLASVLLVVAAACGRAPAATPTPLGAPTVAAGTPPSDQARQMAERLWERLQSADYRSSWSTVPGKGAFYRGQPPHGALLSTYLSPEARQASEAKSGAMPDGATIVKENYMEDRTLDSITVMSKEAGFAPERGDWFWAKYGPEGQVQAAGRVPDCTSCHGAVRSNDFIFTFPIAPIRVSETPSTDEDRAMADELWQKMESAGYRENWSTAPGKGTFYQGQPPHGALLSTYLNPEAGQAAESRAGEMPDGATIVKENYRPDRTLADVTVMYKEEGYAPDQGDWFWAKYGPDGQVQAAGKVAGCASCHGAVRSNDFIFTFPIGSVQP